MDKVKSQPTRAIEMFVGGKSIAKAIGDVTPSVDRPLTDVPGYGFRTPVATIAGTEIWEISCDIISPPDPATTYKQIMQAFFDQDDLSDLDDLFDTGGIFECELPNMDILDQIPIVVIAHGIDSRLLETGTPINDVVIPHVSEVYVGMTLRQLISQLSLGEAHFKRNLTMRVNLMKVFKTPIAVDAFSLSDKSLDSGVDCGFELSHTPLAQIDGQRAIVMVDNEIWHKGFWWEAATNLMHFDHLNGYCPGAPIGLFLREEHTIPAAPGPFLVNLDNVPVNLGEVVTNEFDTERYTRVVAVGAAGEYSIIAGGLTFNAADAAEVVHVSYFSQNADFPMKNITVIYGISRPNIKAGDPFFPLRGSF